MKNKLTLVLLLAFLAGGLGGCAGVSLEGLKMRQYAQEFRYTHDNATAMKAARAALEDMGFELDIKNRASDRMEMVSRPLSGSSVQSRLQRRAIVSVVWTAEGMTMVRIGFWDESEDTSASESMPASGRRIKEGPLYDAFWQRMDVALPPESALLPAGAGQASGR